MEKEIQKTVKKISGNKEIANLITGTSLELDEKELEKYMEHVIREVNKKKLLKIISKPYICR